MQRLIEEPDEALNAAKDNGTPETIGELDNLSQTLETIYIFPSADPFDDPISVKSYITSLNQSRAPSEQQLESLQDESQTTLENFDSLENIISSGKVKVDGAAQLR